MQLMKSPFCVVTGLNSNTHATKIVFINNVKQKYNFTKAGCYNLTYTLKFRTQKSRIVISYYRNKTHANIYS